MVGYAWATKNAGNIGKSQQSFKEVLSCIHNHAMVKWHHMDRKEFFQKNKNKIICFFVTLLLAIVTIYAVFKGSGISFDELMQSIRDASGVGIALAAVCMLGFIYFEGEAVRVIVNHMGYPARRSHGFVYSAADVYFSAITPSASGGQPASAFFMMKDGIPGTAVMAALLLNLVMYTLAVVTLGLLNFVCAPRLFLQFSIVGRVLIISGMLALSGLAILFYMLLKKREIVRKLMKGMASFLRRIHCKRLAQKLEKKINKALEEYGQCVSLIFNNKAMLIKVYVLNFLQRLSQILVTIVAFAALHGNIRTLPRLFATQIYVVLGSNCVPIPGGVGVTDYLMLNGYKQLMEKTAAYQLEILSRGLSFYVCIFVSMVTVVIGYLVQRKNTREKMK